MAEPADRVPPAQKTFNYFKPDPEPFRAPPAQKTFNYFKPDPATVGYTQRAPGAMAVPAQKVLKAPAKAPAKAESSDNFMRRLTEEARDYSALFSEKDTPASDYVDMPLSEFLPRVARGVLPSSAEMAYDVGNAAINAVKHPIDTGKAVLGGLGSLAMGLGSKFDDTVRSAVGLDVDTRESERKQQMLNSVIEAAKGRYGFGEPGEFYKNLADNPASYIMDALALETGGASAAKKIDDLQKLQYERFFKDTTPKTDISHLAEMQYYRPSPTERSMMEGNPTPAETAYMDREKEAQLLRNMGVNEQYIQEQTGIMTLPTNDPRGIGFGDLNVAAMTPQEMIDIRPSRATNYGADIFDDPSLLSKFYDPRTWGNTQGWHMQDTATGQHRIGLHPKASKELKNSIVKHEMTHADLEESGIGSNLSGGNDDDMLLYKNEWLKHFAKVAKEPANKDVKTAVLDMRKKLAGMTAFELYSLNPGEMLARLSQGDASMARRLTPLEVLNPYIYPVDLAQRGVKSLMTSLLTETRPGMSKLKEVLKPYGINPTSDVHVGVPTDIEKAIVAGTGDTRLPPR